jgi:hypothetical protein
MPHPPAKVPFVLGPNTRVPSLRTVGPDRTRTAPRRPRPCCRRRFTRAREALCAVRRCWSSPRPGGSAASAAKRVAPPTRSPSLPPTTPRRRTGSARCELPGAAACAASSCPRKALTPSVAFAPRCRPARPPQRRLIVLRHADAEPRGEGEADASRALSARGKQDAQEVARCGDRCRPARGVPAAAHGAPAGPCRQIRAKKKKWRPDIILTSGACRVGISLVGACRGMSRFHAATASCRCIAAQLSGGIAASGASPRRVRVRAAGHVASRVLSPRALGRDAASAMLTGRPQTRRARKRRWLRCAPRRLR